MNLEFLTRIDRTLATEAVPGSQLADTDTILFRNQSQTFSPFHLVVHR